MPDWLSISQSSHTCLKMSELTVGLWVYDSHVKDVLRNKRKGDRQHNRWRERDTNMSRGWYSDAGENTFICGLAVSNSTFFFYAYWLMYWPWNWRWTLCAIVVSNSKFTGVRTGAYRWEVHSNEAAQWRHIDASLVTPVPFYLSLKQKHSCFILEIKQTLQTLSITHVVTILDMRCSRTIPFWRYIFHLLSSCWHVSLWLAVAVLERWDQWCDWLIYTHLQPMLIGHLTIKLIIWMIKLKNC